MLQARLRDGVLRNAQLAARALRGLKQLRQVQRLPAGLRRTLSNAPPASWRAQDSTRVVAFALSMCQHGMFTGASLAPGELQHARPPHFLSHIPIHTRDMEELQHMNLGVKPNALLVGMLHAPGRERTACGTAKLSRPGSRSCRRASAHWPCSQAAAASASAPGDNRRSTTYLRQVGSKRNGMRQCALSATIPRHKQVELAPVDWIGLTAMNSVEYRSVPAPGYRAAFLGQRGMAGCSGRPGAAPGAKAVLQVLHGAQAAQAARGEDADARAQRLALLHAVRGHDHGVACRARARAQPMAAPRARASCARGTDGARCEASGSCEGPDPDENASGEFCSAARQVLFG